MKPVLAVEISQLYGIKQLKKRLFFVFKKNFFEKWLIVAPKGAKIGKIKNKKAYFS